MGVAAVGDRRRLLRAIASLSQPVVGQGDEGAAQPAAPSQVARQLAAYGDVLWPGRFDLSRGGVRSEDVASVKGPYHTNFTEIVAWRGAHIAKFMDARVLAHFGWPHAAVEYKNTYGLRPSVTR